MKKNRKGSGAFKSLLMLGMVAAVLLTFGLVVVGCDNGGGGDEGGSLTDLITPAGAFEGKVDVSGSKITIKSGQTVTLTAWVEEKWQEGRTVAVTIEVPSGAAIEGVEYSRVEVFIRQGGTAKVKGITMVGAEGMTLDDAASYVSFLFTGKPTLYGNASVAAGKTLKVGTYGMQIWSTSSVPSVLSVKGGGSIDIGGVPLAPDRTVAELEVTGSTGITSKLILEDGATVTLTGHADYYSYLVVDKDAGIYGGTAASPSLTKVALSAERASGAVTSDKLSGDSDGNITVVPGEWTGSDQATITLGKTQWVIAANTFANVGVMSAEASPPPTSSKSLTPSSFHDNTDGSSVRTKITLTGRP
ncbi:hypothetical protein AGMMS50267_13650 [Spirochaetia bacterium]|nr:hypothetical protein AGMMS50267_13650 [Spirochaetia bacterium]